ncbi:EAL domain-containing protein [Colwellia demingiae]|nr:EAL domain-containing protein [Colwellia demingiae]
MTTDSRKILFISISVTLFTMAIIYYSFLIGRDIAERYTPLVDATMEIKLEATTAHLWFEEIMSGDETIDIQDIWDNLDQSEWYAQAMLDGGTNEEGTFLALNDPSLRNQIEETINGIHHFRQMAKNRWASQSISGIGSDIEQQFDLAFLKFNLSADSVESALQKARAEDLQAFKFTQLLLITLILILGTIIGGLSLRYNTRRIKNIDVLRLSDENVNTSQKQLLNVINGAKLGYWDWCYQTGEHVVNDEWLSILGLSRQDITNHISDWDGLIHPNDDEFMKKTVQTHIQSGKNYVVEFRMKHTDGRWVWIQGSGSVIEYDEKTREPLRLCGTHQDITKRKLAELREKSRTHVLELLTSGDLLPVILEAIVRGVEQENPDMLCSILLLDDEGKHLLIGAAPSLPDFYNAAIDGIEIGVGVGSCGTAAFTNERVIVEDIPNHPYWAPYKALASKAGLEACWSEPIRSTQGKVLGTFAIYHHEVNQPTKANVTLIEQVASLASIAIEKIQANLALKASDEQMQLVLAGADLGFWDWNIVTGKVDRNERWATMLGYTHKELKHTTNQWADFVHYEDREKAWQSISDVLEGRSKSHSLEYRMLTKEGGYRWVHDQANVMQRHSNGKPLRMSGTHSDITNRKLAEEKIKLAASVFSHAGEGIIITDDKATIIDVNDAFTNITGFSHEEAIGKNPRILQSGRQSPEFYAEMWQALQKEGYWSGEVWNRRKNGEVYAVMQTISAVRDVHGIATHYVSLGNDITQMKEHQNQLEHIAHFDILTNLPNRVLLADRLSQAMLQCSRHEQSLAVVFLDLDGFKHVNDTYGHDIGDELLIALSVRMKEALRENDSLARIGGDEFVAVLADLTTVEDCEPVLERLLLAASEPVTFDGIVLSISASIGVTLYPQDNVGADLLMRHADQAMYVAKESGKNRYHLFDTAQDDAVKVQRESLGAIRSALDNHQFVLHYQPKVNMRRGTVTGVEALIRWQHPERGLLNPIEFLPVIENNPMSIEMGEWVIDTALTQISQWQKLGLNLQVSVSVNIAAVQLQQPDFADRLMALLAAHPDVEPHYLELEVLETSALEDVYNVSTIMNACIALGVNFSLDDFGTGYSSLTYLRRLPANLIKIDQSFVRDMLYDEDDLAIVEGVIALAKSFKRDVIAEGVETIEHGTALLQLGCELAQGYGIARPMPASDIPAWISHWKPDVNWQT